MPIGSDFNYQAIPEDARRLKRFYVSNREFLTIFNKFSGWPTCIECIEKPTVIPQEARVHGVYIDPGKQGYCVIVEHSSYPEVPIGQEIPISETDTHHKRIGLRVIDKSLAIPMNLSKQSLEEILGCVLEQLEKIAETEGTSNVKV